MTEQIQSVASIDDFEANRAKTKKARCLFRSATPLLVL